MKNKLKRIICLFLGHDFFWWTVLDEIWLTQTEKYRCRTKECHRCGHLVSVEMKRIK